MEKKDDKKKKIITIVISILIIIILIMAVSYAFFRTQLSGTDQVVKVGTLDLVLDETSEGISLDNAIGISDSKGMSTTPSTFKLINNGNKAVDYTIYLDDNTIGDTDTRIDDKYLKYNLNKNGTDSGATLLTSIGSNPNRILDSGTIEGKGTNEYSLNLWITDEVDGNYSGQVFSGKLRVEVSQAKPGAGETILAGLTSGDTYDDGTDTFITGEDPNNYIWYSGKLWRAVSVNNEAKTTKLVTQFPISSLEFESDFENSIIKEWLNDTTVDGFLGNLRDYENFIVTDAIWDATMDDNDLGSIQKPDGTTTVTVPVGLLNMYEYQSSYDNNNASYLFSQLKWYSINGRYISSDDNAWREQTAGIRPSINLLSNIKIVDGNGTEENPYRLEGDNDKNLSGEELNTRYSGEYIRFGIGENKLYRIVSHETEGLTKITSANPLKNSDSYVRIKFDGSDYSSTTILGKFLNEDYLTNYIGDEYDDMIEENSIWYLGYVNDLANYRLAKYTDANMSALTSKTATAKVGLLRLGELMAGQFENSGSADYWLITKYNSGSNRYYNGYMGASSSVSGPDTYLAAVKPALNLKSNVVITGGTGTKTDPFTITLGS